MKEEYQIIWMGFVHDSQGYARAAREYILALDRQGVDVKIEPLNLGTPATELSQEQANRLNELIKKPLAEDKKKVLVYHSQPFAADYASLRSKYDYIICNTVWETDKVPPNWFPHVNQFDAVFIPCLHNLKALRDSGVTVPIFIAPHGADIESFNPINPALPLSDVKDRFTFLSVFQWQHRKAPEVLLKAFWKAFGPQDNVALVIKTYWSNTPSKQDQREVLNGINMFKAQNGYDSRNTAPIYITLSMFSDEHLKGLYTLADAFVLPTRGEGVGLPFIEALSSGIPVISTRYGGQSDFLNDGNSYPIDYKLISSTAVSEGLAPNFVQLFTDDMKWAEPSLESLVEQFRYVYRHQDEAAAKGLQGRKEMEEMTWDKSALSIIEYINAITNVRG